MPPETDVVAATIAERGKVCTRCLKFKSLGLFYTNPSPSSWCRLCYAEDRKTNRSARLEYEALYRARNRKRLLAYFRKRNHENRESIRQWHRANYARNKQVIQVRNQQSYQKHKTKRAATAMLRRPITNAQRRARRASDVQYAIADRLRCRLRKILIRQGAVRPATTAKIVGCDWPYLVAHLKSTMTPDMKWSDFLAGKLHIDHKAPLSRFDLLVPGNIFIANHWSNLQLLWAKDNLKKSNKVIASLK